MRNSTQILTRASFTRQEQNRLKEKRLRLYKYYRDFVLSHDLHLLAGINPDEAFDFFYEDVVFHGCSRTDEFVESCYMTEKEQARLAKKVYEIHKICYEHEQIPNKYAELISQPISA